MGFRFLKKYFSAEGSVEIPVHSSICCFRHRNLLPCQPLARPPIVLGWKLAKLESLDHLNFTILAALWGPES